MADPQNQSNAPIVTKYAYVKLLFLTDKKRFKDKPIIMKYLRGSNDLVNIYDAGLYYVATRFNTTKPRNFKWQFTSEQGTVDDVFQLYPFKYDLVITDPAARNDPKRRENPVDTKLTDSVIVVSHHYNGYQEGYEGEWAGMRADDDTEGMRLVMDFSSVSTLPNKDDALFKVKPWGQMEKGISGIKEPVKVEPLSSRIFTASYNNALKDDVLTIRWSINWDSLALWQAFSAEKGAKGEDKPVTPHIGARETW